MRHQRLLMWFLWLQRTCWCLGVLWSNQRSDLPKHTILIDEYLSCSMNWRIFNPPKKSSDELICKECYPYWNPHSEPKQILFLLKGHYSSIHRINKNCLICKRKVIKSLLLNCWKCDVVEHHIKLFVLKGFLLPVHSIYPEPPAIRSQFETSERKKRSWTDLIA